MPFAGEWQPTCTASAYRTRESRAILRHANLGTTMNIHVKNVDADSVRAMKALENLCAVCALSSDSLDREGGINAWKFWDLRLVAAVGLEPTTYGL
jgi:hypothetical protein